MARRSNSHSYSGYGGYAPYVPVAERRKKAEKVAQKQAAKGQKLSPVEPMGHTIAKTVWGRAFCDHLEAWCDYHNRLPRGRTYVRNGSVVDLVVEPGVIRAQVYGSELYKVTVNVAAMDAVQWGALASQCAGSIDSLVELLQGRFDAAVMDRLCHPDSGMLPRLHHLKMSCSCPDSAVLCKHVAATLYGVGNRLDSAPELVFTLRQVDPQALLVQARTAAVMPAATTLADAALDDGDLGALFGFELDDDDAGGNIVNLAAAIAPSGASAKIANPASGPRRRVDSKAARRPKARDFALNLLRAAPEHELALADFRAEMTDELRYDTTTLRAALTRLENEGLVERIDDPAQQCAFFAITELGLDDEI
jgi:uncharacterized Zn finger protein